MNHIKSERIHAYSPLRYPGGKTRLLTFFRQLIRENRLRDVTYVEPYAGGAGAALGLLISGQVERIVINDLDPAIAAFWHAVVENTSDFSKRLREVSLTVDEWRRQKEIYRNAASYGTFDLGFATFYLNRTNRSGVLNAGPIGGIDQSGKYKIDARFNRDSLLEKIRLIGLYRSRIEVSSRDGLDIVAEYAKEANTLVYADPPYFAKGGSLYLNAFSADNHERLANCLNGCSDGWWILTYDDVPQVDALYSERRRVRYSLPYSVREVKVAQEIMVFSDSIASSASASF